jgi:polysaccharide deacetylase family protein (PEP-CTERM system associated)
MSEQQSKVKKHLLAVLLEDYFQVGAFGGLIQPAQWYRFEARVEQNTLAVLDLLARHEARTTFFVLDWVADKCPELVREVTRRGHEIACYSYLDFTRFAPGQLREELKRLRESLERVSGTPVSGFRSAHRWSWEQAPQSLEALAESGFSYDASVVPDARSLRLRPESRFAGEVSVGPHSLWEFPASTWKAPGLLIPVAGGNYFRQFPHTLIKRTVARWHQAYDAPFVMYFHVWELDPKQPRISSASRLSRIRHYRNLDKMSWVLEDYLSKYRFTGFAEYLKEKSSPNKLSTKRATLSAPPTFSQADQHALETGGGLVVEQPAVRKKGIPVSIIIPCYNEEQSLPYLNNTLASVRESLAGEYDVKFVFVDDASTDGTPECLGKLFGGKADSLVVRHAQNGGVAAAIMTGIRSAGTEVVCSIDCDCTYDPHELRNMIPLLREGVSLVTASPYHPQGRVLNVPAWRLLLSRASSSLYRRVLRQKLATYTSCFRVYRKGDVADLELREGGFLGVAELIGQLDLQGRRVVEHPATLEVRLFGRSKMKLAKTILGHLKLLTRLLAARLSQRKKRRGRRAASEAAHESSYQSTSSQA